MKNKIGIVFACGVLTGTIGAQGLKKPNILFILADDFGWNQVGCNGNTLVHTPNIDKLASEGMRFTHGYVMPQSSPTRGAFFTGKHPARSRITGVTHVKVFERGFVREQDWRREIPAEWYSVANMLRDAGYTTGISGKWHIGGSYSLVGNKKTFGNDYYQPYGFDWTGEADDNNEDKGVMAITKEICSFMETNKDKPFFAWASHFTTHTALAAPENLIRKYEQAGFKRSTDIWGNTDEKPTADFLAMTEYLDKSVGMLLAKLDELGLRENTLVVFMGDNGALGRCWDHTPLRGAKGTLYEGGIRSPLIMRYPKQIQPGIVADERVDVMDLYPTFMEVANGSIPAGYAIDGLSLTPLWTNQVDWSRNTLYFHHPHYEEMYAKTPSSAIIDGKYKLIRCYGDYYDTRGYKEIHKVPFGKLIAGERIELFDLEADPGEKVDISAQHPRLARQLVDKLNNWLDSVQAQIPIKK